MSIIISMAGEGRRFQIAGFRRPKYEVAVRGRPLLDWAIMSLDGFLDDHVLFVGRDNSGAREFVESRAAALGIRSMTWVGLAEPTRGQAHTVALAADRVCLTDSVLIFNIDTHVTPGALRPEHVKGDGWLPCFEADGTHWSFVQFGADMQVSGVAEKVRISPYATVGLYYFKSAQLFVDLYKAHQYGESQEHYVAPLYSGLVNSPGGVFAHLLASEAVVPLGTPEEAARFDPQLVPY